MGGRLPRRSLRPFRQLRALPYVRCVAWKHRFTVVIYHHFCFMLMHHHRPCNVSATVIEGLHKSGTRFRRNVIDGFSKISAGIP